MPLSATVLAQQLQTLLVNAPTEAAAIANFVAAYRAYAGSALAGGVPVTPAGVALGAPAMAAALVGMGVMGAAPAKLTAGCIAFWAALAGGLTTSFAGATAITPPPFAGLPALLTTVFAANVAGNVSANTALQNFATALHAQTVIGGTVTLPGPAVVPIL